MIIDTHCHILPGVDDGAHNSLVTRKMLEIAFQEGIDAIIATPHFECGMTAEDLKKRIEAHVSVRRWAKIMKPRSEIYLGSEIFYSDGVVAALEEGLAFTINNTRYVLVEFPVYAKFSYIERAVRNLGYAGYIPILAHIERYEGMKQKEQVRQLTELGALMQVNASTVTGNMGWSVKRYVLSLMKEGLVHMIGTDAHGIRHRKPEIQKCLHYIDKKIGRDYRVRISSTNPERIIRGDYISE